MDSMTSRSTIPNMWIGIVTTTVLLCVSSADTSTNTTLNAAILQSWKPIYDSLLSSYNFSTSWTVISFKITNPKSQYDKMLKAKSFIENNDIHVVLGPFDDAIAMVTEKMGIPYICTTATRKRLKSTFQIIPPLSYFSQAISDLTKSYRWDKVSLFYDDDSGIFIMEQLLTNHELMVKSWKVESNSNKKLLKQQVRDHLVHMRRAFVQKSIIFCSVENTDVILDQARSLAMLSTPYEWFFYDPGYQLVNVFRKFPDIIVNFTMFGLVNHTKGELHQPKDDKKLDIILAHDSLKLLQYVEPVAKRTSNESVAGEIINTIKQTSINGETGNIEFDDDGKRYNFTIKLIEVEGSDSFIVGLWQSSRPSRLQFRDVIRGSRNSTFPLKGRTVDVVMILEKPFTMRKRDWDRRAGNDRFEGFAVDLITEVATMLKFDFRIYLVHDGKFGSRNEKNGEWNGMIGELLAGNATMSVAPLSINSLREEAVDFTKPFMTRYISVLMKVPKSESTYFEFLNPLDPLVWFCTCGAFVVVSVILYTLEKLGTRHDKDCPTISFRESFWFVFGSLLQGSTDTSPSTLPGRILTSAWWFFALILISSYTANLAAFLTVKKINTPIKSVTDLASQTKIRYGTVQSSGIMSFFQQTKIEHFAKMWAQMSEVEPSSMVANTEEGFKLVKQGNYAFFWDTTVNKYKTIEDCEFMEIGPHFDPKGFGIGVPPGATYREELSMAILRLSDTGLLHQLENKWWGRRNCPDYTKPSADETSELQIENVAGVFFILVGGIAFSIIVCGFEHFTKVVKKAAKSEKNTNNGRQYKERESFL